MDITPDGWSNWSRLQRKNEVQECGASVTTAQDVNCAYTQTHSSA